MQPSCQGEGLQHAPSAQQARSEHVPRALWEPHGREGLPAASQVFLLLVACLPLRSVAHGPRVGEQEVQELRGEYESQLGDQAKQARILQHRQDAAPAEALGREHEGGHGGGEHHFEIGDARPIDGLDGGAVLALDRGEPRVPLLKRSLQVVDERALGRVHRRVRPLLELGLLPGCIGPVEEDRPGTERREQHTDTEGHDERCRVLANAIRVEAREVGEADVVDDGQDAEGKVGQMAAAACIVRASPKWRLASGGQGRCSVSALDTHKRYPFSDQRGGVFCGPGMRGGE